MVTYSTASSITNIVRQMGGSFGVAIFSHLLTQRTAFHTQRYGEALNYTGDVYRQTLHSLSRFIEHTGGRTPDTAKEVADTFPEEAVHKESSASHPSEDFGGSYHGGSNPDVFQKSLQFPEHKG